MRGGISRSGEPESWGQGQRKRRGGIEMKEEGEEERVKEKGEKYNNHHNKQKTRESERKKEGKWEERQSLPP